MVRTAPFLIAALLALPASARAATAPSCRASAARVSLLGLAQVEPVRANDPNSPCVTQSAETLKATTIGPITADAVEAFTHDGTGTGSALAGVSKPSVRLGVLSISAEAVQASATASCSGGAPQLSSASRVVGLQVNGLNVTITPGDAPLTIPLPGGGRIAVNETILADGEVTRRALDVFVPNVGEVVLAEARASTSAPACFGSTLPVTPPSSGSTLPVTPPSSGSCPAGSSFDLGSGACIIHDPGTTTTVVVAPPFAGPQGGTVISLSKARRRYGKNPCLTGRGPRYAIVGTRRADRIIGTARADRILALAGRDVVFGRQGNDCIDGGMGNDRLDGGAGNDRVYGSGGSDRLAGGTGGDRIWGAAGNDRIDGNAGNDRLYGGRGRDRVSGNSGRDLVHGNAGNDRLFGGPGTDMVFGDAGNDALFADYGRDRLYGGKGRDFLDTSILGPTARMIDGGPGFDTARYNPREKHAVRRVERRHVVAEHRPRRKK